VVLLWSGLAISAIGDEFFAVAAIWLAVQISGSNASWLGAQRKIADQHVCIQLNHGADAPCSAMAGLISSIDTGFARCHDGTPVLLT
jgi:hypothetical protein